MYSSFPAPNIYLAGLHDNILFSYHGETIQAHRSNARPQYTSETAIYQGVSWKKCVAKKLGPDNGLYSVNLSTSSGCILYQQEACIFKVVCVNLNLYMLLLILFHDLFHAKCQKNNSYIQTKVYVKQVGKCYVYHNNVGQSNFSLTKRK